VLKGSHETAFHPSINPQICYDLSSIISKTFIYFENTVELFFSLAYGWVIM
jgi:hypothetical protein